MNQYEKYFYSSFILNNHPVKKNKNTVKSAYYLALETLVKERMNNKYIDYRLSQFRKIIFGNSTAIACNISERAAISHILNSGFKYSLICDIALILQNDELLYDILETLNNYIKSKKKDMLSSFVKCLVSNNNIPESFAFLENKILQFRKNRAFLQQPVRRFIITANMSSGKSTLLNAVIGKKISKTSQEVCTGNLVYIFNKPFEDGNVHLSVGGNVDFSADYEKLRNMTWSNTIYTASYFSTINKNSNRICMIDTPGVNSSLNEQHGKLTKEALLKEKYDKAIVVINAEKLGTDDEIAHLKWISKNISHEKIIFVLNKLDYFKSKEDNIVESLNGVKKDLKNVGFNNAMLCPVSAYFALLIKMKMNGIVLDEDEEDEYDYYCRKFKRPEYDLSRFYDFDESSDYNEFVLMSKKCGFYNLEKILFGG